MTTATPGYRRNIAIFITLSVLTTIVWIALVWRFEFDLADEGFYWYGAQRMLRGEIPMRDFMAYDIGRYAWGALFMQFIGNDGMLGSRMSAALFQIITVSFGVWIIVRTIDSRFSMLIKVLFTILTTIILNLWVYPYYKSFDYGASIAVIGMLVMMISMLNVCAWFFAGIILGIVAIIGRNHGVYGAFSVLLLTAFLLFKTSDSRLLLKPALTFVLGVIVGYSPILVMCLVVDGFMHALITSVRDMVQSGSTNIGLPVPWPWTVVNDSNGRLYYLMKVGAGALFPALILIPAFALVSMARRPWATFNERDQLMLALGCAGMFYAHYAFSRADLTHIALSIVPLLMIVLLYGLTSGRPLIIGGLLLAASTLVLSPEKSYLSKFILKKNLSTITVNGVTLQAPNFQALRFDAAEYALASTPSANSNFLALPNAPGLYAMHKVKMPIWEIYAVAPRSNAAQAKEISILEKAMPEMILISNHALDEKEGQRYSQMHALTYEWIVQHYSRTATPEKWSEQWEVYVRHP